MMKRRVRVFVQIWICVGLKGLVALGILGLMPQKKQRKEDGNKKQLPV